MASSLPLPPTPAPGRRLAHGVVQAGLGTAMVTMLALHVLQPEQDPWHGPVSFYLHGRAGWLIRASLAAFGVAAIGLARVLQQRVHAGALLILGSGMLLAAVFPSDRWFPWENDPSWSGLLHATASVLAPPALLLPMAARRRQDALQFLLFGLYGSALGLSGLSLAYGFWQDRAPPFIGLTERLLGLAAVVWMARQTFPSARSGSPG